MRALISDIHGNMEALTAVFEDMEKHDVKDIYTDYEGKRVYFCCSGCVEDFGKDPEKYLKVLEDRGEQVEDVLR